jgi:capsular exopolysaccharide synthesis family protein
VDLASPTGFDVHALLHLFSKRRWLVVGSAVFIFASVAVYTLRQPKVFGASTSVIIDSTAPRVLDNQVQEVSDTGAGSYWYTKEYTETQTRIMTSRSVAERVSEKLGLGHDPEFLGVARIADPQARQRAMASIDAATLLQGKLSVAPVKDTRLVTIRVEDSDPKRAALLANEVAEAYVAETLALKLRLSESANRWLEDRLTELEQKTKQSELAIYDFKKDADMLTTSLEDRASIVSQRLNTYNGALTDVRTRIAGLRARVEAIQSLRRGVDTAKEPDWADVLTQNQSVGPAATLKARYLQEKADCSALGERYLPGHPKLASCLEKVAVARQDLLHELDNVVRGAELELREATAKERNLEVLLASAKSEAFEVNKRQIEFERMKRESDNNQRLYDLVLKRLKDIELSSMLRTSNARVLDAARPAFGPIRPRVQSNLLLGLILGLVGGLALAFLMEQLDTSVTTQADVEERVGVPFLGVLPRVALERTAPDDERDLYVFRHPRSAAAEACRAIRTNLLFMSPDRPLRTMLVTSSSPREGKSTCVITTGIAMAQSGNRVVLIDTDMRRPRLHRALGTPNERGVSSVLVGDATLDEVIKSTEVPGLFVIPSGPIPPNPAELFHTQSFRDFVAAVGGRFDRVIFDSPPVNAVADPVVLATQVDGVFLVIRAADTHRAMARRAVRVLTDVKTRIFGAVLNDVELGSPKYGAYYAAYRGYGTDYKESRESV